MSEHVRSIRLLLMVWRKIVGISTQGSQLGGLPPGGVSSQLSSDSGMLAFNGGVSGSPLSCCEPLAASLPNPMGQLSSCGRTLPGLERVLFSGPHEHSQNNS